MNGAAIAATISGVSAGSNFDSRAAAARRRRRVALIGANPGERPSSRPCKAVVGGEVGHRAGVDDAAVVHHAHEIADLARDAEILLDQQDRHAAALDFPQAFDQRRR